MKISILWLAAVFATTICTAQHDPISPIHPLEVGDHVPDIVFSHMINFPSSSARLSDLKGKLVILDFWATWCSSCINNFSHLDSLQQRFANQLQVILVNSNDRLENVQGFFTKLINSRPRFQLPSAVGDTIADRLFVHTIIPHYVWINSDGKILAFTSSDQVNELNIRSILKGGPVKWSVKNDWDMDKPLVTNAALPVDNLVHYSILLKGLCDGLPNGQRTRTTNGTAHGIILTNNLLLDMYQTAIENLPYPFKRNRILIEVKDRSALVADTTAGNRETWYKQHCYSYDLMVPVTQAIHLYTYMLDDLNRYSGYTSRIEKRGIECLIVKSKGPERRPSLKVELPSNTNDNNSMKDPNRLPISRLVNYLNDKLAIPVLDETRGSKATKSVLPNDLTNITSLQKFLSDNGFTLTKEKKEIEMVILMDAP